MSAQPAVTGGEHSVHHKIAELRKRVKALENGSKVTDLDGAVISPLSITTGTMAAGSITAGDIQAGSITAVQIQAGTITASLIQAGTITASLIAADAINAGHIQANSIGAAEISAGSITAAAIQAGAITANLIQAGAINAGHIQADSINASHIQADAITASEIQANAITATEIMAGVITATHIASNTITASQIAANTITASQINTSALAAMWTTTASLTGGTIIGGIFKTATSGARVEMDTAGLRGYALDGVTQSFNISTGTGIATLTGVVLADPNSIIPGPALSAAVLGGTNMIPNSSFEQGNQPGSATDFRLEGWDAGGTTTGTGASTALSFDGLNSYKLVRNSGIQVTLRRGVGAGLQGDRISVKSGIPYTLSVWANPATVADRGRFTVYFMADNTTSGVASPISTYVGSNVNGIPTTNAYTTMPLNTWTRIIVTVTPPAGCNYLAWTTLFNATAGATNDIIYADAAQLEQGDVPTAYKPKGDEILYSSLRSVFIGAGEIKANNIAAGAITAQMLSVSLPGQVVTLTNGSFTYDAATGATPTGWTSALGTWVTNTDTTGVFQRVTSITTPASNANYRMTQTVTVPLGRHVLTGWVRTTSVTGSTGAFIGGAITTGTGTVTASTPQTGTTDWTLQTVIFDVTSSTAVLTISPSVGILAQGTAFFAMISLQSSIGGTLITPFSITTSQIMAGEIRSSALYSGVVQADRIQAANIAVGSITADRMVAGVIGANILAAVADVDFERTDSISLRGWSSAGIAGLLTVGGTFVRTTSTFKAGVGALSITVTGTNMGAGVTGIPGPPQTLGIWKAGVKYTASCWVNSPWTSRLMFGFSSGDFASVTTTTTAWGTQLVATWTPAADRTTAFFAVRNDTFTSTNTFAIDNCQIELGGEYTAFSSLAAGQITGTQILPSSITTSHLIANSITADKINFTLAGNNLLKNSTWITPTGTALDFWTKYGNTLGGASITATGALSPANPIQGYVQLVNGGTAQNAIGVSQAVSNGILGGQFYSASIYVFPPTTGRFVTCYIDWKTAGGTYISTTKRTWSAGTGGWIRVSTDDTNAVGGLNAGANALTGPFLAPATAAQATVYFWVDNNTAGNGILAAETHYFASAQLEMGERVTSWKANIDPTVIDGGTVTAGVVRTSSGATRVQLDSTGLWSSRNAGTTKDFNLTGSSGLDFATAAGTYTATDAPRQVRWINGSGNPIAGIGGSYDSGSNYNYVGVVTNLANAGFSAVVLASQKSNFTETKYIQNEGGINVYHNNFQTTLINDNGELIADTNVSVGDGNVFIAPKSGSNSMWLYNSGSDTFHMRTSASSIVGNLVVGVVGYSSDASLKKNIKDAYKPSKSALTAIKGLRPVTFEWKDSKATGTQVGFIAQEVQPYVPEVVVKNGPGDTYTVDYSKLTTVLVGAVKELTDKVERLEARLATM